jgi:hypothetical protein
MPIYYPDILQTNNPNNAIVDSDSVRGGGRVVADLTALYALSTKSDQLKARVTKVYVTSANSYYTLIDANNIGNSNGWSQDASGVNLAGSNGIGVSYNSGTQQTTLSLGDITPTSVVATGNVTGSNLSGTNTGDETQTSIISKIGNSTFYPLTTNPLGYATSITLNTPSTLFSTTGVVFTKSGGDYSAQLVLASQNNHLFLGRNSGTNGPPSFVQPTFSDLASTPTTLSGYGITDTYTKTASDGRYALQTTTISVSGSGITGGGDLSANRTISLDFTYLNGQYQPLEDQRLSTTNSPSFKSLSVTNTDGTGVVLLSSQTTNVPSVPSAGTAKLYYNSNGLTWLTPTGFSRSFLGTGLSANRIYTLPDANGTLTIIDAAQTLTNKTISGSNNTITNISLVSSVTSTLPLTNGGTGLSTLGTANQGIYVNQAANALGYRTWQFGTSGTDVNMSYTDITNTINIPDASVIARGLITTGAQSIAGAKTWTGFNTWTSSINATSGTALGQYFNSTLTQTANADSLIGVDINPSYIFGSVLTVSIFNAGSGLVNGTYTNVSVTGQTAYGFQSSGAILNITVSGGIVTSATVVSGGNGNYISDNLTLLNASQIGGSFTTLPVFRPTTLNYTSPTLVGLRVQKGNVLFGGGLGLGGLSPVDGYLNARGIYLVSAGNSITLSPALSLQSNGILNFSATSGINFNVGNPVFSSKMFGTGDWVINQPGVTVVDNGYLLDLGGSFRLKDIITNNTGTIRTIYNNQTIYPALSNDSVIGVDLSPTVTVGSTSISTGTISSSGTFTSNGTNTVVWTIQSSANANAVVPTGSVTISGLTPTAVTFTNRGYLFTVGDIITTTTKGGTVTYTVTAVGLTGVSGNILNIGSSSSNQIGQIKLASQSVGVNPTANQVGSHWWNNGRLNVVDSATTTQQFAYLSDVATTVVEILSTTQAANVNTKYIANNTSLVTITLPATATQGQQVLIRGKGTGGWKLAQNSGQTIHGSADTTTGTGGSIASQSRYDCVTVECITANTDWIIINNRGTLTIV